MQLTVRARPRPTVPAAVLLVAAGTVLAHPEWVAPIWP